MLSRLVCTLSLTFVGQALAASVSNIVHTAAITPNLMSIKAGVEKVYEEVDDIKAALTILTTPPSTPPSPPPSPPNAPPPFTPPLAPLVAPVLSPLLASGRYTFTGHHQKCYDNGVESAGCYCADEGDKVVCDRPRAGGWESFTIGVVGGTSKNITITGA